ncbi:MAG: cytochrome c oxidase, subunit [Myxococcales bacterium]|nr:cytochrome c oxidase, subunit [Myxococcales bacterium]
MKSKHKKVRSPLRPIAAILVTASLSAALVVGLFGTPAAVAQPGHPTGQGEAPAQTAPQPAPNPGGGGVVPPPVTQPNEGTAAGMQNATGPGSGVAGDGSAGSGTAGEKAQAAGAAGSAAAPAPAGAPAPAAGAPELPWYEKLVNRPIGDDDGNFWMPKSVNTVTDSSDLMFISVLALSTFFFVGIAAAVIYLTIKYRHRPGHKAEPSASHNDAMEITWTVIPTIITVFLFYYGWRSYINIVTPPQKAVEINVQAWRWAWNFKHSNGVEDADLHVPVNTPVRLVMTSRDVLHAFYVPVLRTKQDIIPRRYTYVWFNATKPGTYRLACAEYCGTNHSQMGRQADGRRAVIVVHEPGDYERYLADKAASGVGLPPDKLGAMLYDKKGCVACHTTDGSPRVGPTFKGSFGSPVTLADGSKITVDENYIRESLLYPQAKSRPGFPPSMPSFEGQLKEKEIEGLIAFIKSLK